MLHYYVLFDNHTDAMEMYRAIKAISRYAQTQPDSRAELSVCCGVSLLVKEEDVPFIKELAEEQQLRYISISGLDNEFNSGRHRYG